MYEYRAKLIKCVDGDTADFLVDLGFKVFKEIRTRFLGVDTPERGHADFNIAKNKLQLLLENQKDEEDWIVIKHINIKIRDLLTILLINIIYFILGNFKI